MDGNKIVGFWVDNHGEPADFNVIVNAYEGQQLSHHYPQNLNIRCNNGGEQI